MRIDELGVSDTELVRRVFEAIVKELPQEGGYITMNAAFEALGSILGSLFSGLPEQEKEGALNEFTAYLREVMHRAELSGFPKEKLATDLRN
jgi:hypothetical protein